MIFKKQIKISLKSLNRKNINLYKKKKIIAIIPARSGSKRLINKNKRLINGKPLISWTIESALSSKLLDEIFVSTDSNRIKNISIKYGLKIPFMRPSIYAKDNSPTYQAIIHTLNKFNSLGKKFDYLVLLEPTSPLRKKNDIDRAIKKIIDNNWAKALISLGKIHLEHPKNIKKINLMNLTSKYINFNKFEDAYFPYGVIYISKVSSYYQNKTFYTNKTIPYIIDRWQNYEIDDFLDFKIVESIMKMKRIKNG